MSIYDVNFTIQSKILIRNKYRLDSVLDFLKSLLKPLNWLADNRLRGYKNGLLDVDVYDNAVAYNTYDLILWSDGGVYMRYTTYDDVYPDGVMPTDGYTAGFPPPSKYWLKVLDSFVGADERINYDCTLLSLEYMLNRWFAGLNPSIYPSGFWPDNYPDRSSESANRPIIYIENLATDSDIFLAGLDVTDSSSVGRDSDDFIGKDYVRLDTGYSFNKYSLLVNYPLSLINVTADNEAFEDLYIIGIDPKFIQLEALINKHKHLGIQHAYKSH